MVAFFPTDKLQFFELSSTGWYYKQQTQVCRALFFLSLGLETHVTVLDIHREQHAVATQTLLQRIGLRGDQSVESRKREIYHGLATTSLGFQQRVIKALNGGDIL